MRINPLLYFRSITRSLLYFQGLKYNIAILLIMLLGGTTVQATNYYVRADGSDGNNGTSQGTAWLTATKPCTTAVAGDTVWFMGGVYEDSVLYHNPSYGTMIVKNDGEYNNHIVFKAWPDSTRPLFRGNANTCLEAACFRRGICLAERSHITIDGLECWGSLRGIDVSNTDSVFIYNCVSHHNTGSGNNNTGGIVAWQNAQKCNYMHVVNCTLSANYDGIFIDSTDGGNVSGLHLYEADFAYIAHNVVYDQPLGNGIFLKGGASHTVVCSNTVYNCFKLFPWISDIDTCEISFNLGYDINLGEHAVLAGQPIVPLHPATDSILIYNNTFYNVSKAAIAVQSGSSEHEGITCFNNIFSETNQSGGGEIGFWIPGDTIPDWWSDYNCIFRSTGNNFGNWKGGGAVTLSAWRTASGHDANSINTNPYFVDAANNDFRLSDTSGCRTTGRGGIWPTYMGAISPDPCIITHDLTTTDSTTSSFKIENNYTTDSTVTVHVLIWDDDNNIADPLGSDSVTTGITDPDTLEATGLSAGTQYWCWWITQNGSCRDTSLAHIVTTVSDQQDGTSHHRVSLNSRQTGLLNRK